MIKVHFFTNVKVKTDFSVISGSPNRFFGIFGKKIDVPAWKRFCSHPLTWVNGATCGDKEERKGRLKKARDQTQKKQSSGYKL